MLYKGGIDMRVPTGRSLASWIKELIRSGEEWRFYKTDEWLELREEILREHHYECAMCKEKEPAVYSRAEHVHHVNEVKDRPDLALSRTYRDPEGTHPNLIPLCMMCHNVVHERFQRKGEPLNEERW